jgi:hypothetical protein
MKQWDNRDLERLFIINQFLRENNSRRKKNLRIVYNLTITNSIFFKPLFPVL